jgi:hypothetical protein
VDVLGDGREGGVRWKKNGWCSGVIQYIIALTRHETPRTETVHYVGVAGQKRKRRRRRGGGAYILLKNASACSSTPANTVRRCST